MSEDDEIRKATERAVRDTNVENRLAQLERAVSMITKAVIGAAIYLASQVYNFIAGGGSFGK